MTISEIKQAADQARTELSRIDLMANDLADLLVGRLRHVSWISTLIALKKELRKFNIHTGRWAD